MISLITDPRLRSSGFMAGTLSRHGGNMGSIARQENAYRRLNIDPARMLHLHQVHGNKLITISSAVQALSLQQQTPVQDADGWLLSPALSGWGVSILTADCVPLFVWNKSGTHAALSHCGWRGVVQQLPFKTAKALCESGAEKPFYAWAGPHIQACCFEVQADTACQFPSYCIIHRNGKLFVDLNAAVRAQLLQAGLSESEIVFSPACTFCDRANLFSWRRDHVRNLLVSFLYKL